MTSSFKLFLCSLVILFVATQASFGQGGSLLDAKKETKLLRFPAVHGDQVVFSYAGDLYTVSRKGGTARQLTDHPGYETFPKYSHDGTMIAFTGQYDGNTEVYVIPAQGGTPKRITYTATLGRDDIADRMGPNNIVMDWTPDDKHVLYRSRGYSFNSFKGQLYKAPLTGDISEEMPFSVAGFSTYNEDGSKLAMNRIFREFRTWKYYKGGMAGEIWLYDFASESSQQLTKNPAQDIFPMAHGDKVFFLSDRDRTMNLFVHDLKTSTVTKVTSYTEYDIKWPSLCKDAIAYENGGKIFIYDIPTGSTEELSITVADDFTAGRNKQVDASKNITDFDVSPDGNRLVFSARGDVYSVPARKGVTRNLTRSSGAHDRDAIWSPDGKWIAFISDQSGEDELYVQKQDGSQPAKALTKGGGSYKYQPMFSPDSKYILMSDRSQDLYTIDVATGKKTVVFHSDDWEVRTFNWSPDSRYITFVSPSWRAYDKLHLYDRTTQKDVELTHGFFPVDDPAFSPDGKYLYFTSDRDFHPIYNDIEWNHAYKDMSKIYMVTLDGSADSPFALQNNEVGDKQGSEDEDSKSDSKMKVDLDGIESRIEALEVPNGEYWNLTPTKDGIFYMYYSRKTSDPIMKFFSLREKEEYKLKGPEWFLLAADGEMMVIEKKDKFYVIETPEDELDLEEPVDLSGMKVWVDKRAEWNQIYKESWRQMRDYFYDPDMHGLDWPKIHDKYAALLPYVNHRNDLNYLIGEMIGELSVGHAYVNGGDRPDVERIKMGLLGARYSRHSSGFYKIERILEGANWDKSLNSPLKAVGVDVNVGDYIIAINGVKTSDLPNISAGMIGLAGQATELTVNASASESGTRKVVVMPLADESRLYYHDWVEGNLRKVTEATDGKVGYVHVPDMGPNGLNQFARYFYPQIAKKALIIDDRGNGGGNVSPMLIERLRREVAMGQMARNVKSPGVKPDKTLIGPKVCLIDPFSASDGDLFPYQFRFYNIGKLIGQRTWGGVVGIRGSLPFIDGGDLRKPEFAHYAADGSKYIIEGYGVDPDIEVVNDPHKEWKGEDVILQKGIDHLLEELKKGEKGAPSIPPFPDKSK